MRRIALTCSLLGSLIAAGCSSAGSPDPVEGPVAQATDPIAYGTQDTKHTAVVALLASAGGGSYTECSGSIVKVSGGYAYVLTAAHCCNQGAPSIAVASGDYSAGVNALFGGSISPPVYAVDASSVYYDSQYNQLDHDFCMLKFATANNLATLALPTSCATDGVADGVSVEHVGFGMTENDNNLPPGQPGNSKRLTGTDTISSHTGLTISYDQGGNTHIPGPCEGDSGGPALIPAGQAQSAQHIVATTSYGMTQTCGASDTGVSSRVCSEIGPGGFITNFLNDTPSGTQAGSAPQSCGIQTTSQACTDCIDTSCCAQAQNCVNSQSCSSCLVQNPPASCNNDPGYNALLQCVSNACASPCGGGSTSSSSSTSSSGGQSCGIQANDPTCNSCLVGSCCAQASACANDASCVSCVQSSNPGSSCASNAHYTGLVQCLEGSCATPCGLPSSSSSSSSSGSNTTSSGSNTTSSGSNTTSSGTGGATNSSGGGTGANGNTGGGDVGQKSGCSVGAAGAGADPTEGAGLAGLLLGLGLAVSRRRRSA
jgi:MYXO-CTERM domain-containing protein